MKPEPSDNSDYTEEDPMELAERHAYEVGYDAGLQDGRLEARPVLAAHARLQAALIPLRNDIVDAAETDTRWEEVARAMGWLS